MKVEITPTNLQGEVLIPFSKSYSHRHLIASFLANSSYKSNYLICDDTKETENVLNILKKNKNKDKIELPFGKSASTLRFLIPILLLTDKTFYISQSDELYNRPLNVYKELFENNLTFKYLKDNILMLKGPIIDNQFEIEGDVSSQFISGLLFALPLLKHNSKIILKSKLVSKNYVDITIDVLKKYNIKIEETDYGYLIFGNQHYVPYNYEIEKDFSQAANWFVAGTINGGLKLNGLNNLSLQGDKRIIDIINESGGEITFKDGIYNVVKKSTKNIQVDLKDVPDLGPILFVLAAQSKGESKFLNVSRLKIKESNRLNSMIFILNKFGVETTLNDDNLYITSTKTIKGNISFENYKDHRLLMAIFILALNANGKVIVDNVDAINKSYPNFLTDYINLGGKINVIK